METAVKWDQLRKKKETHKYASSVDASLTPDFRDKEQSNIVTIRHYVCYAMRIVLIVILAISKCNRIYC